MGNKVLLVDTGFSAQPIYESILNLGYEAHVVGGRPDDALAKSAEKYWCLDYSDTSKLADLIKKEGYRYIVPGCTDLSYLSCSTISNGVFPGLEPPENDSIIHRKNEFRHLAQRLNVSVPKTYIYKQDRLDYPVIVKPVDSYSGQGIRVVENEKDLLGAIEYAKGISATNEIVIEQFVDGQLYSHSAFIENTKIVADFIVQENSTANPFAVDLSTISDDVCDVDLARLKASIELLAEELNLKDGLLHTQFIFTGTTFYLIEMTRRCPGDLYSQLIELQTGFPYVENYVRPFLGLKLQLPTTKSPQRLIIRHTFSSVGKQTFTGVTFSSALQMEKWIPLVATGEMLNESAENRVGIGFIKCDNAVDQQLIYNDFLQRSVYQVF